MSTQIGEVNINLRLSLAKFREDVQNGSKEGKKNIKDMGDDIKKSSREAKESLELIGDQIGIHIPRSLRTVIAELPGFGQALNAAFSSVAVVALIGILAEVLPKIKGFAEEIAGFGKEAQESFKKLIELNEELVKSLEKHRENQFQTTLLGLQGTAKSEKEVLHLNELREQKTKALNDARNKELELTRQIAEQESKMQEFGGLKEAFNPKGLWGADAQAKAKELRAELDKQRKTVTDLNGEVLELGDNWDHAKKQFSVDAVHENDEKLKQFGTDMQTLVQRIREFKGESPYEKILREGTETETLVRKMAAENPAQFEKAFPNDSVQSVVDWIHKLTQAAGDKQLLADLEQISAALRSIPAQPFPIDLKKAPTLPTLAPGAQGKTSAQKDLAEIQANAKAAEDAAQKIRDAVETDNQKYKEQIAIIEELKQKQLLTPEQAAKAMKQAQDAMHAGWTELGKDIGDTLKQAALFGRSWSDALKSISIELAQLIIKMAFMKDAAGTGGTGGGLGSIFGGLISGLFGGGKASGGNVDPNHWYMVGEHGPEPFVPSTPGTIIPHHAMMSAGEHKTEQTINHFEMHVHGVTDHDSFKKSESQIAADMAVLTGTAGRRYKG